MNRSPWFLVFLIPLLGGSPAGWGASGVASEVKPAEAPNILFILVDDLGWADLGCYGADLHQTPNIDRLAGQGVRFTQAYAAAPVCSPTRASLLTGRSPARLHLTIWSESAKNRVLGRRLLPPDTLPHLPLEEETLAEVFRSAGYRTVHIGKWHLGDASFYPQAQGYDVNIGGSHWGAPNTFWYPYSGDETFRDYRYVPHLEDGQEGEYLTDRLTNEAIRVMETAGDKP